MDPHRDVYAGYNDNDSKPLFVTPQVPVTCSVPMGADPSSFPSNKFRPQQGLPDKPVQSVTIQSTHKTFLRAQPDAATQVDLNTIAGDSEVFAIEPRQDNLVAIRSKQHYVRAHPSGKVDLALKLEQWGLWKEINHPDGTVSFESCHKTYLRAKKGGQGASVDLASTAKNWERWSLLTTGGSGSLLPPFFRCKTHHGTWLRAHPGKGSLDQSEAEHPWTVFSTVPLAQGKIAIRTAHGTFVRATSLLGTVDCQTTLDTWETWEVINQEDKRVALKSVHGNYLRAHKGGDGSKIDLQSKINSWEKFEIIPVYH